MKTLKEAITCIVCGKKSVVSYCNDDDFVYCPLCGHRISLDDLVELGEYSDADNEGE